MMLRMLSESRHYTIKSNYIQFESFLIIHIGHYAQYVINLTKTMKLNNLTQEILNLTRI